MSIMLFIGFNLLIMSTFFVLGIYQFLQIEDKQKRRPADRLRRAVLVSELDVDESAVRQLVRDERYTDAIQRLITDADVDRFTAEAMIEVLKKQEYRPFFQRSDAN
jgi:hypothetical protein